MDATFAYARMRHAMVARQLEPRGIRDPRVLAAMGDLPRHRFVPRFLRALAYEDRPLPIGSGQTISQPYIVALMTQCLDPPPGGRILEVGTGSGYQAAVLSRLCREVVSVERLPELAARAEGILRALAIGNVTVREGDGSLGLPDLAPYDGIVVTAGAPAVSPPLLEQLAEGGRLVAPIGGRDSQRLELWRKEGGRTEREVVTLVTFVPLVGEHGWKAG